MTVNVEKTDRYTVEFWFRPDVTKAAELAEKNSECDSENSDLPCASKGLTYLFTMENLEFNVMTIYVEDGLLKCSPFGRNKGFDLVYEGAGNPLEIDKWQHISCVFSN
jgi:hypothetical protein